MPPSRAALLVAAAVAMLAVVSWSAVGSTARQRPPPAGPGDTPAGAAAVEADPAQQHVLQGEVAFNQGDLEGAHAHYLAVIEADPDHPLAAFALYKLAWVEYEAGDLTAAIRDMRLVHEWVGDAPSDAQRTLAADAAQDLARFEAEANED